MGSGIGQYTPYYVALPSGEVGVKVRTAMARVNAASLSTMYGSSFACLTASGKLYGWGINNGMFATAWPVTTTGTPVDTNAVKRVPVPITISGETSFVDMDMTKGGWIVVASSGKAYFNGAYATRSSGFTTYKAIPFPAGVNVSTFKYTNAWLIASTSNTKSAFLKGNDGNLYATGAFLEGAYESGVPALQAGLGTAYNMSTSIPQLVPFPAGETVVKISLNEYVKPASYALTASGKIFATGIWKRTLSNDKTYQFPLKTAPAVADLSYQVNSTSDSTIIVNRFLEVPLPAGIGATKFIDVENAIETSGTPNLYVITDNNYVYWSGDNTSPYSIQNFIQYVSTTSGRSEYVDQAKSLSPTAFTRESINLRGTVKLISKFGLGFAIGASARRGYAFGVEGSSNETDAMAGIGRVYTDNEWRYPIPLANEQLDATNTSPGSPGVTPSASVGVGVLDCSKTQIMPAPVSGVASNATLMITINVATAGVFTPTISGSGFSLLDPGYTIKATTTGPQTFPILVSYDGTALDTLTFSTDGTGNTTCNVDMTQIPKNAIVSILTADCIPTAGPGLK